MSDDDVDDEGGCLKVVLIALVSAGLMLGAMAVIGWIVQGAAPVP